MSGARWALAPVLASALWGCATVVPMQTSSVVEAGRLRFGGQATAAGFCNLPDVTSCNAYPDGVPLPEVRADARRGMGRRFDVGASLQVQPQLFSVERPLQLGLTVDGKRELLRASAGAGRLHVLSAGVLVGAAAAGRLRLPPWAQVELGVPVFYGLRVTGFELVAGASFSKRLLFPAIGSAARPPTETPLRLGFSFGLFRMAPEGWAVQLSYLTEQPGFAQGAVQLQFGWFFEGP